VRAWAAVCWLAFAGGGPEALTLPGFRLHLVLSEDIEPDRLEALARPGVVLWLETRSNILRRSVAERLDRAEASYVQLRSPLLGKAVGEPFRGRVHPWVVLDGLDVPSYRRWAPPVGTAVDVSGTLTEERLGQLRALHPQAVRWQPEEAPTSEEWARAGQLSGLEVHATAVLPPCVRPLKQAGHVRLRVPVAAAEVSAAGCGFGLRLEIPLSVSEADVRALLVQYPGAEMWARIGGEADAAAASVLVSLLTAAAPPSRPVTAPGPPVR
jgi:hypothetical protein